MKQITKKDFISIADFTKDEIEYLIKLAIQLKNGENVLEYPLEGKTLAMIFSKSSTRTRVSFEAGIYQLGGMGMFLSKSDIQLGRGEPISDTAKVLSGYVDGIMIRTHAHSDVLELAENASIPVINGLTDEEHPCQILADLLTVYEEKGSLDVKIAWVGDGNNVAASLALAAQVMGIECSVATPHGYELPDKIRQMSPDVQHIHSPEEAVEKADVVYTDVWASMGQEEEKEKREKDFAGFQVNDELVSRCNDDYIFMHCLPAYRGSEVSASVIDGAHSVVFAEAENRLHAQKAVMFELMG